MRLSRRLAPAVYLGARPLTRTASGQLGIGGDGEGVDWLVEMRRLDRSRMLDVMLASGRTTRADLERGAAQLARFYAGEPPAIAAGAVLAARLEAQVRANHAVLARLDAQAADALRRDQLDFLAGHRDWLETRASGGCVIEAHGDLRPEHVLLDDPPAVIDCLEFDRQLRILDRAEELAFLELDCGLLGASDAGRFIARTCLARLGDTLPAGLEGVELAPADVDLPHGRRVALRRVGAADAMRQRRPPRRQRRDPLPPARGSGGSGGALDVRRPALRAAPAARRVRGLDLRAQGRPLRLLLDARDGGVRALRESALGPGRYGLVAAAFACALASKPMAVTLPILLLLLDAWPLDRGSRGAKALLLEKLPLLALSAGCAAVTYVVQREGGAMSLLGEIPVGVRAANAGVAAAAYVRDTLWPSGLAVIYPYPPGGPGATAVALAAVVLAAISAAAIAFRRRLLIPTGS